MKRYSLMLCMVTFLALGLFCARNAHATLVKVDFQVNIIGAESGNPFEVAVGDTYQGFTIYDDFDILDDTVFIGSNPDYRLRVTVGTRTFREWEDPLYGFYPLLFIENGNVVGIDFWVEFSEEGLNAPLFKTIYHTSSGYCDFSITHDFDSAEVVYGDFTNFSTPTPIPEPATMLLMGAGLAGLAGLRRKFKKA